MRDLKNQTLPVEGGRFPAIVGDRLPRVRKASFAGHKTGVIDEDYVQKAKDPGAVVGRKVRVTSDEVAAAIAIVETLGKTLYGGVIKTAAG